MSRGPLHQQHSFFQRLLHRLPWNNLYWLVVLGLFAGAIAFGTGAVLQHRSREIEKFAEIKDGDVVKVLLILNGDEVLVEKDGGRAKIRMLAIRSFDPVVNEREITTYGHATVAFLEHWILNRQVKVHFDEPIMDNRGRYLAYLERDNIDVNERMVEEGIAFIYTEFKTAREGHYLSQERLARNAGRGVWGGKKAVLRIEALRHEWASMRRERSGTLPPDYLLGEISR